MNEKFELNEIEQVLEENHDLDKKEIGDRVICMDFTTITRLDGSDFDESDTQMQFNSNIYLIVIADKQKSHYDSAFAIYNQDLIIVNPKTNIKYRAFSGHVKLKQ